MWHSRASRRSPIPTSNTNSSNSHSQSDSDPDDQPENSPAKRQRLLEDFVDVDPSVDTSPDAHGADHHLPYPSAESSSSSSFTLPPDLMNQHSVDQVDHDGYKASARGYCPCLMNPAASQSLIMLTQQLQAVSSILSSLPEHQGMIAGEEMRCLAMTRIENARELLMCVLHRHYLPHCNND